MSSSLSSPEGHSRRRQWRMLPGARPGQMLWVYAAPVHNREPQGAGKVTSAHPPNFTSKCEGVPSSCLAAKSPLAQGVHAALIRGLMLNRTSFFLLKSILSWWELPSRWVPFVLLFTRTSDPSETRIMYKLMGKGGIKSTWILPNSRQQTNVGGLSFQTNKQTNQETKSLLPQVKKKKGKKKF